MNSTNTRDPSLVPMEDGTTQCCWFLPWVVKTTMTVSQSVKGLVGFCSPPFPKWRANTKEKRERERARANSTPRSSCTFSYVLVQVLAKSCSALTDFVLHTIPSKLKQCVCVCGREIVLDYRPRWLVGWHDCSHMHYIDVW